MEILASKTTFWKFFGFHNFNGKIFVDKKS